LKKENSQQVELKIGDCKLNTFTAFNSGYCHMKVVLVKCLKLSLSVICNYNSLFAFFSDLLYYLSNGN